MTEGHRLHGISAQTTPAVNNRPFTDFEQERIERRAHATHTTPLAFSHLFFLLSRLGGIGKALKNQQEKYLKRG